MSKSQQIIQNLSTNNYEWISFGEADNPIIAFIAPSNGMDKEEGQKEIIKKITSLVEKGLCVKVPRYIEDDSLLIEPEVAYRKKSAISISNSIEIVSPATSSESGASQIIDCILNGWNIMPLMGGGSFDKKIPIIVKYFIDHPEQKNPNVKIFGFSDSTYATVLSSRGICSFISTTFISVFDSAKLKPIYFFIQAQQLEKLLKGQETEVYSRSIIYNPENKLSNIRQTFHYPLNLGNLEFEASKTENSDNEEEKLKYLEIAKDQSWSISIEGFLQCFKSNLIDDHGNYLNEFLQQHQDHLPAFIEIGIFATRLDGNNGYKNLLYDESNGQILISEDIENDYNINKVYANKQELEKYAEELFKKKKELESSISDNGFGNLPIKKQKFIERQFRLLSPAPDKIFDKLNFNYALSDQDEENQGFSKEDIAEILKYQNLVQENIIAEMKEVGEKYQIPLIRNTRNGHCVNMSIVEGGNIQIEVASQEDKVFIIQQPAQSITSSRSDASLLKDISANLNR